MPLHECDNCGAVWKAERLNEIKDYSQRVAGGEIAPSGECPSCGALCHPQEEPLSPELEAIASEAVEQYGGDDINIDATRPEHFSEGDDGTWVRAWVWVGKDEE